jgi:hypothetical protein
MVLNLTRNRGMIDITATKVKCREMLARGEPVELVLRKLRDAGLSKIESMRVFVDCNYSLKGAKELVHLSETWFDVRARDDEFHDSLAESLHVISGAALIVDSLVKAGLLKAGDASRAETIVVEILDKQEDPR